MARRIESHFIDGPAGRLEALLEEPEDREPIAAAVVCHPHPLYGGTMHNKVVYRTARALRRAGRVVLRFNFRGVNLSAGSHDHGAGEVGDARAALEWLRARYPDLPFELAGFSFGSRVALRLGCETNGISRVIAIGFPTRRSADAPLESCAVPKIFIQSTHDEHGPREELEAYFTRLPQPKRLEWVESADHFFRDALDALEARVYSVVE